MNGLRTRLERKRYLKRWPSRGIPKKMELWRTRPIAKTSHVMPPSFRLSIT